MLSRSRDGIDRAKRFPYACGTSLQTTSIESAAKDVFRGSTLDGAKQEKLALVLLIKEILSQVDEVSFLRSRGHKADLSMELLREMCSVLNDLSPEQLQTYQQILPTLTASAPPFQARAISAEYIELSVKPKRKFIEKIRGELKLVVNE